MCSILYNDLHCSYYVHMTNAGTQLRPFSAISEVYDRFKVFLRDLWVRAVIHRANVRLMTIEALLLVSSHIFEIGVRRCQE